MRLVDDDVAQRAEEPRPPLVIRQHRIVQHVRVRQQVGGVLPREASFALVRVAVEGADPPAPRAQPSRGPGLVVRQRLGGREVQRGVPRRRQPAAVLVHRDPDSPLRRGEDRHEISERLAGPGGRADHRVPPAIQRLGELRLVRPRAREPRRLEARGRGRPQPVGPRRRLPGARRPLGDRRHLVAPQHPLETHPATLPAGTDISRSDGLGTQDARKGAAPYAWDMEEGRPARVPWRTWWAGCRPSVRRPAGTVTVPGCARCVTRGGRRGGRR